MAVVGELMMGRDTSQENHKVGVQSGEEDQKLVPLRLLVVDDDPLILESIRSLLPSTWEMVGVEGEKDEVFNSLSDPLCFFHAALVDMHFSKAPLSSPALSVPYALSSKALSLQEEEGRMDGLAEGPELIARLAQAHPKMELIGMSGDLSLEMMETCLRNGASRFLAKPLRRDELLTTLEKIEAYWQIQSLETPSSRRALKWLGSSLFSERLRRQISHLRGEVGPILIQGETGTGKEVICHLLNQQEGPRPLVAVNISSLSESLFESEMYGHVKGAFTGADRAKIGLAEAAHNGDLFLDEIESLPYAHQVKLLRFLESGEIRRVGSEIPIRVNARVIVASNQDLRSLVSRGAFREDLFHRLCGVQIYLKPLRDEERQSDLVELAFHFLKNQAPRINKQFSPEALALLGTYSWPGNVRELKRICEQLALISPLPFIRERDVEALLSPLQAQTQREGQWEEDRISLDQRGSSVEEEENFNDESISSGAFLVDLRTLDFDSGLTPLMHHLEELVLRAFFRNHSMEDMEGAASQLKISRSNLYKKIKSYGIE